MADVYVLEIPGAPDNGAGAGKMVLTAFDYQRGFRADESVETQNAKGEVVVTRHANPEIAIACGFMEASAPELKGEVRDFLVKAAKKEDVTFNVYSAEKDSKGALVQASGVYIKANVPKKAKVKISQSFGSSAQGQEFVSFQLAALGGTIDPNFDVKKGASKPLLIVTSPEEAPKNS